MNSSNFKIIRKLNKLELALHIIQKDINAALTPYIRVNIRGEINEFLFAQIIKIWQNRHSSLQSSIQKNIEEDGYYFCKGLFTKDIPFKIVDKSHEDQWKKVGLDEATRPFDINNEALLRIIFLKSDIENIHDLLFIFHHSIIDMNYFFYLLDDLFTLYKEELKQSRDKSILNNEILHLNKEYTFTKNDLYPGSNLYSLLLSAEETRNLLNTCHKSDTSLHALMTAAFSIAISPENKHTTKVYVLVNKSKKRSSSFKKEFEIDMDYGVIKYNAKMISNVNIWTLARYYNLELVSILRKKKPNLNFLNSNLSMFIFPKLLKIRQYFLNLFSYRRAGINVINVMNEKYYGNYDDLSIVNINWDVNSLYDKRKNFILNAVIFNDELNISFIVNNSSQENACLIKNNLLKILTDSRIDTEI